MSNIFLNKMINRIKKILKSAIILFILMIITILFINFIVIMTTDKRITQVDQIQEIKDSYHVGLILGCAVYGDRPSPMLKERLDAGIALYKANKVQKLLMSGDNLTPFYKEVDVMRDYAILNGVPEDDILLDNAGLSTYDSMYRAKEHFDLTSFIVISQKYHLHRALYISQNLGMSNIGVSSDQTVFSGQTYREFREILARNKDFLKTLQKSGSLIE